jgi:hypothetical protein
MPCQAGWDFVFRIYTRTEGTTRTSKHDPTCFFSLIYAVVSSQCQKLGQGSWRLPFEAEAALDNRSTAHDTGLCRFALRKESYETTSKANLGAFPFFVYQSICVICTKLLELKLLKRRSTPIASINHVTTRQDIADAVWQVIWTITGPFSNDPGAFRCPPLGWEDSSTSSADTM